MELIPSFKAKETHVYIKWLAQFAWLRGPKFRVIPSCRFVVFFVSHQTFLGKESVAKQDPRLKYLNFFPRVDKVFTAQEYLGI